MRILIAEDEHLARLRLTKLLTQIEDCEVIGEASNGDEAVAMACENHPDVILMDVRMPGLDGLTAAKIIMRKSDHAPLIVFCTAYDEYALEAFDAFAVGYLVKPVQQEKLTAVLENLRRTHLVEDAANDVVMDQEPSGRQHISAKMRQGLELIPLEDVFCFMADQKYVTVYHANGEALIDDTIKDLENEFANKFVRIHRSALVAIDHVLGLEKNQDGAFEIKFKGSDFRPVVSRRHLSQIRQLLSQL